MHRWDGIITDVILTSWFNSCQNIYLMNYNFRWFNNTLFVNVPIFTVLFYKKWYCRCFITMAMLHCFNVIRFMSTELWDIARVDCSNIDTGRWDMNIYQVVVTQLLQHIISVIAYRVVWYMYFSMKSKFSNSCKHLSYLGFCQMPLEIMVEGRVW